MLGFLHVTSDKVSFVHTQQVHLSWRSEVFHVVSSGKETTSVQVVIPITYEPPEIKTLVTFWTTFLFGILILYRHVNKEHRILSHDLLP